jgi:hypothetical protein
MPDSLASWMIAGGPRDDEHDQLAAHRLALREIRAKQRAVGRAAFVDRIRGRFAPAKPAESLDGCVA